VYPIVGLYQDCALAVIVWLAVLFVNSVLIVSMLVAACTEKADMAPAVAKINPQMLDLLSILIIAPKYI
jgi:hypothetical protein